MAAAEVLDAVSSKKPVPQDSLAKLVGAPWAAYLAQQVSYDPTAKAPLTAAECKDMRKGAAKLRAKDMTSKDGAAFLAQVQSADCGHPPSYSAPTRACVTAGFHTAADLAKCAPASEPPESEFGDHALVAKK